MSILQNLLSPSSRAADRPVSRKAPDSAPDAETAAEAPVEADRFDPAEHTVAEVVAYLGEHPDASRSILAAERRGKARKGILGG